MKVSEIEGETRPLADASDEELADELQNVRDELQEVYAAIDLALLDEEEPLTGEDVAKLWEGADDLAALSRTLVDRVPPQERVSTDE